MGIKKALFWGITSLSVISIAILFIALPLPLFDDSISKFSLFKDITGIILAIIGLKLAYDWKEQMFFSQKNIATIDVYKIIVEINTGLYSPIKSAIYSLEILLDYLHKLPENLTSINFRYDPVEYGSIDPIQTVHVKSYLDNLSTEETKEISKIVDKYQRSSKILSYRVRDIEKYIDKLKTEKTKIFILRDEEIFNISDKIISNLLSLTRNLNHVIHESVTESDDNNLLADLNIILDIFLDLKFKELITVEIVKNQFKMINDDFGILKKLLGKYY